MKGLLLYALLVSGPLIALTPGEAATITVPANPIWTDTGISLAPTDAVALGPFSGAWNWGGAPADFGPAGDPTPVDPLTVRDLWISTAQHGELIGFVGTVSPYSVGQDDPRLFAVGAGVVTGSGRSGELWLGINDDRVSGGQGDNSGSLTVEVTVQPGFSFPFIVTPPSSANPHVESILVNQGPVYQKAIIHGSGFADLQGTSFVTLGGHQIPVLGWSNDAIGVLIVPSAYGQSALALNATYPVQVVTPASGKKSNTVSFFLTDGPPP